MSDDVAPVAEDTAAPPEGDSEEKTFSQDYVRELREEAAEWRKKYRAAEAERKAQDKKVLEEQGRWQDIAAEQAKELERLAGIGEQFEAVVKGVEASNEARIARIPEAMRGLVPPLEPIELARWLDASESVLTRPAAVGIGAESGNGDRPTGSVVLTDAQRKAAKLLGVSEEDYLAQLKKR